MLTYGFPTMLSLSLTDDTSQRVEGIVAAGHKGLSKRPAGKEFRTAAPLAVTTFVGGGGPRFWFSVSPEQQQPNYAQVLIQLSEKEATPRMDLAKLQPALSKEIPGA